MGDGATRFEVGCHQGECRKKLDAIKARIADG
jgi:hypothetical protein